MDPATIIGLVIAFGSLYAMLMLEGSSVSSILLPAPMVLVFGATLGAALTQLGRARPAPRREVRLTITPNARPTVPPMRSRALSTFRR